MLPKAKSHADEDMVQAGRVRELDRIGNNAADEAADFRRRRICCPDLRLFGLLSGLIFLLQLLLLRTLELGHTLLACWLPSKLSFLIPGE